MIRKSDICDIPVIIEMACDVFPHTYADILTPEQIDYMMDMMYGRESLERQFSEGHVYFISDGKGYVSVSRDDDETWHLQKLYVLPGFQKTGLGRELFLHAAEYVASMGAGKMCLNVNRKNPAISFYRKMGMEITSSGDFPIGNGYFMNDYIMTLYFK